MNPAIPCWRISGDLTCPDRLEGIGHQFGQLAEKMPRVRHFRVYFESLRVDPFGMDEIGERLTRRFVEVDADAARFGAAGRNHARQFIDTERMVLTMTFSSL